MAASAAPFVRVTATMTAAQATVLTADALALLADLHRRFEPTRQALLAARKARQARFGDGELPDFLRHLRRRRAKRCAAW